MLKNDRQSSTSRVVAMAGLSIRAISNELVGGSASHSQLPYYWALSRPCVHPLSAARSILVKPARPQPRDRWRPYGPQPALCSGRFCLPMTHCSWTGHFHAYQAIKAVTTTVAATMSIP